MGLNFGLYASFLVHDNFHKKKGFAEKTKGEEKHFRKDILSGFNAYLKFSMMK